MTSTKLTGLLAGTIPFAFVVALSGPAAACGFSGYSGSYGGCGGPEESLSDINGFAPQPGVDAGPGTGGTGDATDDMADVGGDDMFDGGDDFGGDIGGGGDIGEVGEDDAGWGD